MRADEAKAGVIDRVAAIARDRARPEQADDLESFVRRYYVNAPPDDLTEVDPVDLYGAAIAHWSLAARRKPGGGERPRLQPTVRPRRLADHAHRGRDGHRRHALLGRLGAHGAESERPRDPHGGAPGDRGQARWGGGIARYRRRRRRRRHPRVVHPHRGGPPRRPRPAGGARRRPASRARRRAGRCRGLAAHAR